jgi:hypothetical protein
MKRMWAPLFMDVLYVLHISARPVMGKDLSRIHQLLGLRDFAIYLTVNLSLDSGVPNNYVVL